MRDSEASERTSGAAPYRGIDRRGLIEPGAVLRSRPFVAAAGVLLALTVVAFAAGAVGGVDGVFDVAVIRGGGQAAATGLVATAAGLLLLRWRLVGDAPAAWAGAGLFTFAVVSIGLGATLPRLLVDEQISTVLAWLRPAGVATALGLLIVGYASAEVDARLSGRRLTLAALLPLLALAAALPATPWLAAAMVAAPDVAQAGLPDLPLPMALAWTTVAALYAFRGIRRRRTLFAWVGLALLGLALAELLRLVAATYADPSGWVVGGVVVKLAGGLALLAGALVELSRAWMAQSRRLLDAEIRGRAEAARARAAHAEQAERAHEARNALKAIEGATLTLERHREQLPEADREQLAAAVTGEVARLQRLVAAERAEGGPQMVDLVALAEEQASLTRARGTACFVEASGRIRAWARPAEVAEIVQNLLSNAERHGDGPVVLRVAVEGASPVVRVDDRGPGIAASEREAIFTRGVRGGEHTESQGLGLYVSRRLAREQGGELGVDDRPGGGASFWLRLPALGDPASDGGVHAPSQRPTQESTS